jgi:oxygen-independent coproporphyrinogen-3 oxidase
MKSPIPWNSPSVQDLIVHPSETVFAAGIRNHHVSNTAYPIAHGRTMSPYLVRDQKGKESSVEKSWEGVDEMGLYVHIPFCEKRCAFCEYTVVDPATVESTEDRYFDLLEKEFSLYAERIRTKEKRLVGFDIGGGTPSAAKTENILKVVELAKKYFNLGEDVVISIETTPKIAANSPGKIRAYYEMGIRRISMGVQTISPKVLELV